MDEIKQLITCHYQGESVNIQWAFLFCLLCGLRFCNVKDLTYSNVDFANQLLKFEQAKTKDHSSTSSVVIPLSDGVLELIGKPSVESNRDELIFPLPSYTMCLKALRHWSKRTGIDKHIIWHCARHAFAHIAQEAGAESSAIKNILGHSNLATTERYMGSFDTSKTDNTLRTLFKKKPALKPQAEDLPNGLSKEEQAIALLKGMSPEQIMAVISAINK